MFKKLCAGNVTDKVYRCSFSHQFVKIVACFWFLVVLVQIPQLVEDFGVRMGLEFGRTTQIYYLIDVDSSKFDKLNQVVAKQFRQMS